MEGGRFMTFPSRVGGDMKGDILSGHDFISSVPDGSENQLHNAHNRALFLRQLAIEHQGYERP